MRARMGKLKRLQDIYRFPGFIPMAEVRGVFGDPWAVVITLRRRRKKRAAGSAGAASRTFYDQRPRRVRDISCGDRRVYLDLSVRRVDCRRCGGVKRERLDWLADNPLYTKRFAFYVGQAVPGEHRPGGRRGAAPRLAHRQGAGQAVHAGATPPGGLPGAAGHRHRRDRRRQAAQLPHRGQRPGAGAADLVRRQGPLRGEPGRVLRLARPQEMPARSAWPSWTCGRRSATPPSRRATPRRPGSSTTSSTS